ncbi:MAG TPA: thioredoxin domain-containing protein [Verrucomicrobiae bacterium]|jgi:hypothetical protein|nr:thioredoxin domain-containing protein [Verrucomicrobiae bacterium]
MNLTAPHKHTNRLAREKSPYLLQHAHNPVDWFAWNDEAFEKARRENKPIFLSIGYSTCHWCHVMERESFENEGVAAFLNEHFVSIKVDREERPDVDKIYMTFVQATTGSGGWPMTVFLTPELKPFFGGTYFPPDNRHGRPGFLQLLRHIQQLWETRRDELVDSAIDAHAKLEQMASANEESGVTPEAEDLRNAGLQLKRVFDPRHGGFGGAPKFPQPSQPQFFLRYAKRFGDQEAVRMVLQTCERMAAGGIHDQLGGGFARYSVDAEWLVPHFEKMLYDNAQLVQLYLDAHLVSGEQTRGSTGLFAETVRDILDYVLRDMTHPEGGFYSAEDADSEGHEGKFYCWTRTELEKLLTPEEFNVTVRYFGITEQGNFVDHSHPEPLAGQNVLSVVAPELPEADKELLALGKRKMLEARAKRVRPHLDDKILASWNGLMLGAFARAYAVLGDETYRAAAERNVKFVQEKLWQSAGEGTLFHRWRDGERDKVELLDGYAFMLSGVIELYEATLEPLHLDFAIALADVMLAKFFDAENGGFWQSLAAKDLILRVKEDYDGAEPSGNSVATMALLKLGALTGRAEFTGAAEKTLKLFGARLQQAPQAVPYLLCALDFSLQEPKRVVVAGEPGASRAGELLRAIHSVYQPDKVVLGNRGAVEEFARTLPAKDGAVVYLCTGNACQAPTSDVAEVKKLLI